MDIASAIKLSTMIVSICLALIIVKRYSESNLNTIFALYVLSVAASSFCEFQLSCSESIHSFQLWKHFDFIMFLTIAFLLHFILLYVGNSMARRAWFLPVLYAGMTFLMLANSTTFGRSVADVDGEFMIVLNHEAKVFYYISIFIAGLLAVTSFVLCLRFYHRSTQKRIRMQSGFLAVSILLLMLSGIFIEIIAPLVFKVSMPLKMSATTAFLFVNPLMAFAIIRYDVLRIHPETAVKEVLDRLADGVFFADSEGRIQYVNRAGSSILGLGADQIIGHGFIELLQKPSEELKKSFGQMFSMSQDVFVDQEAVLGHSDGQSLPVSISCVNFTSRHWGLLGIIITVRDISERKKAEEIRENIEKILHHDLRTPLMGVIGYPAMMIDDANLDEEQKKTLADTINSGKRILDMIESYLNLQKLERGVYKLKTSPVDIVAVANVSIDNIRSLEKFSHARFDFILNSSPVKSTDQVIIVGDESLFTSMLTNLIQNAAEASPANCSVTINIDTSHGLKIEIHNSGAIPLEIRDRFLTKYVTFGKKSGTGLGAYSSKLIAEKMGGIISVKTDDETGTTISIVFGNVQKQ